MLRLTGMSSGPRLVGYSLTTLIQGAEYQAVVEYAPIEKTPFKTKSKSDHHQGTIDKGALLWDVLTLDSDYLSFLASLEIVEPKQVLETSSELSV